MCKCVDTKDINLRIFLTNGFFNEIEILVIDFLMFIFVKKSVSYLQDGWRSENNQEQSQEGDQTNETVASLNPNISIEKIDSKTVIASWPLVNNESLILTPAEIKSSIKEICENNRPGHLLSFSSSEGIATATFKCW